MSLSEPESVTSLDEVARELLGGLPERWGRMDRMSRMALVAVGRALAEEKKLAGSPPALQNDWTGGLIVAGRHGSLAADLDYAKTVAEGPGMASPHLFSYTLPNIPLAEAAIQYRLTGPVYCLVGDVEPGGLRREARHRLEEMNGPREKKLIITGIMDIDPAAGMVSTPPELEIIYAQ
ncbi:MAG: hypothetical protein Kow0089_05500 [Desulfobulbaceae bacterium]